MGEKQGLVLGLLRLLGMVFGDRKYVVGAPRYVWKGASSCVMTLNWEGGMGQVIYIQAESK